MILKHRFNPFRVIFHPIFPDFSLKCGPKQWNQAPFWYFSFILGQNVVGWQLISCSVADQTPSSRSELIVGTAAEELTSCWLPSSHNLAHDNRFHNWPSKYCTAGRPAVANLNSKQASLLAFQFCNSRRPYCAGFGSQVASIFWKIILFDSIFKNWIKLGAQNNFLHSWRSFRPLNLGPKTVLAELFIFASEYPRIAKWPNLKGAI